MRINAGPFSAQSAASRRGEVILGARNYLWGERVSSRTREALEMQLMYLAFVV
ncbi:hypothetical protein O4H47_13560 [Maritalea porphyrae]|nr:hypothetical protein [Maritalea porphyrae]